MTASGTKIKEKGGDSTPRLLENELNITMVLGKMTSKVNNNNNNNNTLLSYHDVDLDIPSGFPFCALFQISSFHIQPHYITIDGRGIRMYPTGIQVEGLFENVCA